MVSSVYCTLHVYYAAMSTRRHIAVYSLRVDAAGVTVALPVHPSKAIALNCMAGPLQSSFHKLLPRKRLGHCGARSLTVLWRKHTNNDVDSEACICSQSTLRLRLMGSFGSHPDKPCVHIAP